MTPAVAQDDEKAALRRQLAQLPAKKRLDALLEAPNAAELIAASPAEDLYFAIAEVGLAEASELVQLATPEQFRTFVDLGGWQRDRLDAHRLLTWIRAARGDEPEAFLDKLQALDLELLEALLRAFTVIHDLEENPDANPEGVHFETPEGKYLIELKVEGVELFALKTLLNDLIAQNPFESARLFEAVRWELPSELEETAYQFRSGRLADLGFPELEVALTLFTFVDPASVSRPGAVSSQALARNDGNVDYLAAALRGLSPSEQEALEGELRYLVNAALVAEGAEPGDLEAVKAVSERARDYLLLGLEFLTHAEPTRAATVVQEIPIRRVFQVGFSLTLQLKFRADRLMRSPLAKVAGVEWLLDPPRAALLALRRKRPLKALKVEGAEPVPFRSERELAEARRLLDQAEQQLVLFSALLGPTPETARERLASLRESDEQLEPETVLAGVVAWAVLEGALKVQPIARSRLNELGEKLFEGEPSSPGVRKEASERVRELLRALVPAPAAAEAERVGQKTLERLLTELGRPFLLSRQLGPEAETLLPLATPSL